MMIKPTIGRVVWFWDRDPTIPQQSQPHAALVTYVNSDTDVNLAVFDAAGQACPRMGVRLIGDSEEAPNGPYCEWMPFQKGQAAKTEALEASAGKAA